MTKTKNRRYLICIEDDGIVYTHAFSRKYSCGSVYYTCFNNEGVLAHTETEIRNSIVVGFSSAKSARNSLIKHYRNKLPKGERLKVFIKRIYDKDMGMLKKLT